MKHHPWLLSPLLSFFIVGLALGQTFPTNIQYQSVRQFPSLQKKIGSTLGIAPFKDDRSDKPYVGHQNVGHQTSFRTVPKQFRRVPKQFRTVPDYFKSEPFPLEKAIGDSIAKAVSHSGIKTVPIPNWDRKPESLKNIGADSVLMIEIKRFWAEGIAAVNGTKVVTSIYLVIHLGVKREGKVFTRNIYAMKESTVVALTPAEVELTLNHTLTEILDNFLSNPY